MSGTYFDRAAAAVKDNNLVLINPCLHAMSYINLSMPSRPGAQLARGQEHACGSTSWPGRV